MPRLQRRRPGRKARTQRQHILWLQQLSEVQIHLGQQANRREVPQLRQRVPGGKESESRPGDRVPQQGMRLRTSGPATPTESGSGSQHKRITSPFVETQLATSLRTGSSARRSRKEALKTMSLD